MIHHNNFSLGDFLRTEVPFAPNKLVLWPSPLARFDFFAQYRPILSEMPGHIARSVKHIVGFTHARVPDQPPLPFPRTTTAYPNLESVKVIFGHCWSGINSLKLEDHVADCERAVLALDDWLNLTQLHFPSTRAFHKIIIVGFEEFFDPSGYVFEPRPDEGPVEGQLSGFGKLRIIVGEEVEIVNSNRKKHQGEDASQVQVEFQTYAEYMATDDWRTEVPQTAAAWMQGYDAWIAARRERVRAKFEADSIRWEAEQAKKNRKKKLYHGKGSYTWK